MFKINYKEIKKLAYQLSQLPAIEQVKAVEQGIKPITILDRANYIETNLPHIEFQLGRLNIWIFYRPETENYAEKAKELLINSSLADKRQADYHIKLGKLLGYSNQEILDFVNNVESNYIGAPVDESYIETMDPLQ